jgi:hypothetical protein
MGLTKAQLEALNISSFPDNTSELITPEILRTYNSASIANTVNQDTYTTDSASFDSRIDSIVTGTGFVTTSSFNAYTSSNDNKVNSLINATASYANSASVAVVNNAQQEQINSLIAFTGSNTNTSLNSYTASNDTKWSNLGAQTGSFITESETGSFATSAITASSLITASISGQTLTFTKGDSSTFGVIIPTGSGGGTTDITALNAFTASQLTINTGYNTATASLNSSVTQLNANTASQQAQINSLNTTTASLLIETANLELFSASTLTRLTNIETTTASLNSSVTQLNANTASQQSQIDSLISATGSYSTSSVSLTSLNSFTSSQLTINTAIGASTSSLNTATASLFTSTSLSLTTASFSGNTLTFTKGNGTTFGVVIPDVSGSGVPTGTISGSSQITDLGFVSSSVTASSLITASAAGSTITFTKGDASSFSVTVDTGSAGTTIYDTVYTGQNITKGDPLYISGSQGANPIVFKADASNPAKMPVIYVAASTVAVNNTTEAIILGHIEGVDLTGYVAGQTIYVAEGGGWSANLPSGSASITQLLGVVTKGGNGGKGLVLNPGPAQLPGLDTGKMWVGNGSNQPVEITTASFASSASFNSYTSSTNTRLTNIESTTASLLVETQNLELFSASALISLSNLNTATASLFTSTSLSLTTASFSGNTLTFTKGNGTTFGVVIPDVSGSAGNFVTTSSFNAYTASQEILNTTFATTGSNTFTGGNTFNQQVDLLADASLVFRGNGAPSTLVGIRNPSGSLEIISLGTSKKVDLQNLSLLVSGTFTASLEEGYAWVGGAGNISKLVATSSFGGGSTIDTGSFATTGSNAFFGTNTFSGAVSFTGSAPSILSQSFSGSLITNLTDIYTDVAAVQQIVTLTSASYAALASGSLTNPNTLYIVSGSTSGSGGTTIPAGTISSSAQISTLGFVSSSVTASSLITASFSGNTLTFTKGDASTFGVVIPDISGSTINTGSFATTGSNSFIGNQIITGSELLVLGEFPQIRMQANAEGSGSQYPGLSVVVDSKVYQGPGVFGAFGVYDAGQDPTKTIMSMAASSYTRFNPEMVGGLFGGGLNDAGEDSVILLRTGSATMYVEKPTIFRYNANIEGSLTASLQTGYAWVGGAGNISKLVATSSFAGNTIDTGSFATTGSNTFNGNQIINGTVTISGSATTDLTVVGQIFVSSSATAAATAPKITVSGSAGTSTINRNSISTRNTTNTAQLSPAIVFMNVTATSDEIGFSVDPANFPNWSFGPGIYVNNTTDTYPAIFGFQNKANYTDGRVTVLTPLIAQSGSIITGSLAVQGDVNITGQYLVNGVPISGSGGGTTDTGSLMRTGSVAGNVLTFTKGDATTFSLTVETGSGGSTPEGTVSSSAQILNYGIFATTSSNSFNGNQTITGSLIQSGAVSIQGNTTFINKNGDSSNVILGNNAMSNITGSIANSIAIGSGAMRYASGSNQNVAIGENALAVTIGTNNFGLGAEALANNTFGSQNVAIGVGALNKNTTGGLNTVIGNDAGFFASGSQNTYIGASSGNNITGSNNTILGRYQGSAGQTLTNNIILADGSGTAKAQYSGSAWSLQDEIKLNKGSNKPCDVVNVLNGTATINNSLVTSDSVILVTTQQLVNGGQYPAIVTDKTAGSFVIRTNQGNSITVAYLIINPTA